MNLFKILLIALCLAVISPPVLAQENEHQSRRALHPCGDEGSRLELNSVTSYFEQRWQAFWADLKPRAMQTYIAYHSAEDRDISLVRVFRSYQQPKLAVVSARRQVNFLDGKPLVDMMCIVKLTETLTLQYTTDELETILKTASDNI